MQGKMGHHLGSMGGRPYIHTLKVKIITELRLDKNEM